jgi:fucose permease
VSRRRVLVVIWITFFAISLVTNILGPLVPDIIRDFHLSLSLLATLPLSFFLAYGVCSIPAGVLVERYREKRVMLGAFVLVLAGSLAFALRHDYVVALGSLFTIGVGMALLQVAINPLLRVAGGEQHFAFYSVLGQLVFGLASFLSPFLYSFLATRPGAGPMAWTSLYWIFVAVAAFMIVIVAATPFPTVVRTEEESAGTIAIYAALLRKPLVIAYFVGIFAYVGTEQGVANWMSELLHVRHGLDPQTAGAQAVAWFWGLMTAGCALGLVLLRRLVSRVVLGGAVVLAIVLLALGLFGPTAVARVALPAMGFAASVMWSVIFSLALNSVPEHHGAFSGILCTAIVGGAAVPFFIAALGDRYGLRTGMLTLFLTLAYMLAIAVFARPLVVNETRT